MDGDIRSVSSQYDLDEVKEPGRKVICFDLATPKLLKSGVDYFVPPPVRAATIIESKFSKVCDAEVQCDRPCYLPRSLFISCDRVMRPDHVWRCFNLLDETTNRLNIWRYSRSWPGFVRMTPSQVQVNCHSSSVNRNC